MSANQELSKIVDLDDLPSPPSVAAKLLEIFSDPSLKVMDLVKTLSADPILSARIIAYANSPTISVRREVVHLKQAVVVLGMRMVKTIALSFSIIESGKDKSVEGFDLDDFWNRSLVRAVSAKHLCSFAAQDADLGFLSGLMMEIGELAVAFSNQSKSEILEAHPEYKVVNRFELQDECDLDKYRLGGLMLQNWMFPSEIIGGINTLCSEEEKTPLQEAMILATGIGQVVGNDNCQMEQIENVKRYAKETFQISHEVFESIYESIVEEWREYATLLQFDSSTKSLAEIEKDAKKQMTSMTMSMQQEVAVMSEQNEMLKEQVNVDQLTGLENRRSWECKSAAEKDRAYRNGSKFSILVLDIDHFKKFNDTHGHAVGDKVLCHVAHTIDNNLRKYDQAFRIGGEEFVVLLPQCDIELAVNVAERLRECIDNSSVNVEGQTLSVTVSIGAAEWYSEAVETIDALFERADTELYRAKENGRNQVCGDATATIK